MINAIRGFRKRWFVVAVSMALLAVGLTFGSAFAAGVSDVLDHTSDFVNRGGGHHGNSDAILDWVASDLSVTRTALDEAFDYAYDQQANASFEEWVQDLVDDETLTSDQATTANDWFDDRPTDSGPIALKLAKISDSDTVDDRLADMVDDGKITQAESDALDTWHDDRPEDLPASSSGRGRHGGRGRH